MSRTVTDVLNAFRFSVRNVIRCSMCIAFVSINRVMILAVGGTRVCHFVPRAVCATATWWYSLPAVDSYTILVHVGCSAVRLSIASLMSEECCILLSYIHGNSDIIFSSKWFKFVAKNFELSLYLLELNTKNILRAMDLAWHWRQRNNCYVTEIIFCESFLYVSLKDCGWMYSVLFEGTV
jgi:hypothetical protein